MNIKIIYFLGAFLFTSCTSGNKEKLSPLFVENNSTYSQVLSTKCEDLEFLKNNVKKLKIYNMESEENIPYIKYQNSQDTRLMKVAEVIKFNGDCAQFLEFEQIERIGISNEFIPIKRYRTDKRWQNFRYEVNESFYESKINNTYPKEVKGEFIGALKSHDIMIGLWIENNVSKLATYYLNKEGIPSNAIMQLEIDGILDRVTILPTLHSKGGTLYLSVKKGNESYFLNVGFNYGFALKNGTF